MAVYRFNFVWRASIVTLQRSKPIPYPYGIFSTLFCWHGDSTDSFIARFMVLDASHFSFGRWWIFVTVALVLEQVFLRCNVRNQYFIHMKSFRNVFGGIKIKLTHSSHAWRVYFTTIWFHYQVFHHNSTPRARFWVIQRLNLILYVFEWCCYLFLKILEWFDLFVAGLMFLYPSRFPLLAVEGCL